MRSKLWDEESKIKRSNFPTMATMLKEQLNGSSPAESQEEMVSRYKNDL